MKSEGNFCYWEPLELPGRVGKLWCLIHDTDHGLETKEKTADE